MAIERYKLDNGIKMVASEFSNTSAVSVIVVIKTGSRNETGKINGISHFLEHMNVKGTKKYPTAQELTKEIDSMGAEFNASTGKEHTAFYIKSAKKDFDKILDLLREMAFHPLLDSGEMEKERGTIIEEINMYEDHPMAEVQDLFLGIVSPNQFLAQPILGNSESVRGITRDEMKQYHDSHYKGGNTLISMAGSLPKDYKKRIEDVFKDISQGKSEFLSSVGNKDFKKGIKIKNKKIEQAHLVIGTESYNILDKKKYPADILSVVLGGNMSSRLFDEIREKRGLAYYLRSHNDYLSDSGYFAIRAGVTLAKTEEALEIIKKECARITEDITDEEIEKAKSYIAGSLALEEENSLNVALDQIDELFDEKIKTLDEKRELYNAVTKEEVKEVTKDLFHNKDFKLAVIGPFEDEEAFAKIIKD